MTSSESSNAVNRIAFDNLRRIGMYWGMSKEIQQMGGGKKKKNKKVKLGGNRGSDGVAAAASIEAARGQDCASKDLNDAEPNENETKRKTTLKPTDGLAEKDLGGTGGGG